MDEILAKAARVKKALVAFVALLGNLIAAGVVPDEYVPYVVGIISLLAVFGVYQAQNAPNQD